MPLPIKINRIPGASTECKVTIELTFDAADPKAVERFVLALRELIPEDEREQFVTDFQAAGIAAGFHPRS
jgi:hypothetical protein